MNLPLHSVFLAVLAASPALAMPPKRNMPKGPSRIAQLLAEARAEAAGTAGRANQAPRAAAPRNPLSNPFQTGVLAPAPAAPALRPRAGQPAVPHLTLAWADPQAQPAEGPSEETDPLSILGFLRASSPKPESAALGFAVAPLSYQNPTGGKCTLSLRQPNGEPLRMARIRFLDAKEAGSLDYSMGGDRLLELQPGQALTLHMEASVRPQRFEVRNLAGDLVDTLIHTFLPEESKGAGLPIHVEDLED